MPKAINKVISGDFKTKKILYSGGRVYIEVGFFKTMWLDRSTVQFYKVLQQEKNFYKLQLLFSDGKTSIIEVKKKIFVTIEKYCDLNTQYEIEKIEVEEKIEKTEIAEAHTKLENIENNIKTDVQLLREELWSLKELVWEGLLTEEEFQQKRKKVIEDLLGIASDIQDYNSYESGKEIFKILKKN